MAIPGLVTPVVIDAPCGKLQGLSKAGLNAFKGVPFELADALTASSMSHVEEITSFHHRGDCSMAENLTSKSCTPCRGGIPPLTPEEVDEQHRQTPAWDIRDDSHRIERTFRFKTFAE